MSLNLKVNYIQGKNLSITKQKIKVELQFSHTKPISFTTKLEFQDDTGRSYSIPISGTTDNSIITNYSYLQRNVNEYTLDAQPNE